MLFQPAGSKPAPGFWKCPTLAISLRAGESAPTRYARMHGFSAWWIAGNGCRYVVCGDSRSMRLCRQCIAAQGPTPKVQGPKSEVRSRGKDVLPMLGDGIRNTPDNDLAASAAMDSVHLSSVPGFVFRRLPLFIVKACLDALISGKVNGTAVARTASSRHQDTGDCRRRSSEALRVDP